MRQYSDKISLIKNSRGIYGLDTSIGCSSGMVATNGGCYGDCYAAKSAKIYGYDFTKTVLRYFKSEHHKRKTVLEISKIKMPFIRIGCSGDPSENWQHCIDIIKVLQRSNKQIVIITRHWNLLTDTQLEYLSTVNVCINTSVSALDKNPFVQVEQYNRIKKYCKSVLRIISCDFNLENTIGHKLAKLQYELFKNDLIIDTVFRPLKNSSYIIDKIINIKTGVFNGNKALISKFNKKTYTGKCVTCKEMCGIKLVNENNYNIKRKLVKQLIFFYEK